MNCSESKSRAAVRCQVLGDLPVRVRSLKVYLTYLGRQAKKQRWLGYK